MSFPPPEELLLLASLVAGPSRGLPHGVGDEEELVRLGAPRARAGLNGELNNRPGLSPQGFSPFPNPILFSRFSSEVEKSILDSFPMVKRCCERQADQSYDTWLEWGYRPTPPVCACGEEYTMRYIVDDRGMGGLPTQRCATCDLKLEAT